MDGITCDICEFSIMCVESTHIVKESEPVHQTHRFLKKLWREKKWQISPPLLTIIVFQRSAVKSDWKQYFHFSSYSTILTHPTTTNCANSQMYEYKYRVSQKNALSEWFWTLLAQHRTWSKTIKQPMTTWSPHWNNYVSQVGWCGPEQWVWAETVDSGLYIVTASTSRSWISFSVLPRLPRLLLSSYFRLSLYPHDILQGVNKMAKEEEAYKWSTEDMWFSQIVELHIWLASILSKSALPDRLSRTRHHCRFVEMISMQAVSRTFMRMSFKPQNQQQLLTARSFCAAPPIAERIQVMTQLKLIQFNSS